MTTQTTPARDHRMMIIIGLLLGLMLAALEVTVVATVMPAVIEELGGQHLYSLPFALYLLLATVSGPLWGYAADLFSRRWLYLGAVTLFLIGSSLSGAAQSMMWLVVARAIQGLGGGGLQTLTFTIVGELYPLRERAKVQSVISGVWGVAALLGPLVGGFIVDAISWRWAFYLNVPFGIAAVTLVMMWYRTEAAHTSRSIDLPGALIFTIGAGMLIYGLEVGNWALLAGGVVLLAVFVLVELRQKQPLVPLRLLGEPLLARTILSNLLAGVAFFGITAYLPLFAQMARGASATEGGAILSPMTIGWVLASIVAARVMTRMSARVLTSIGAATMALGFGLLTLSLHWPLWMMGTAGLVCGLGMGVVAVVLLVWVQERAPRAVLGSLTAFVLFSRNIGGSLGSALMGALLGDALEDGPALSASFWQLTLTSTLLSVAVLVIVMRLPATNPDEHLTPRDQSEHPEASLVG